MLASYLVRPKTSHLLALLALVSLGGTTTSTAQNSQPDPRQLLKSHRDPLVRESAAQVLGQSGRRDALDLLQDRMLNDSDPWVRASCAEALGRIGDRAAQQALKRALAKAKHNRVRRAVATALVRIGERAGLWELMWQLRAGTNHDRADSMHTLVATFGKPFGQTMADWWRYFRGQGHQHMGNLPLGSPAISELRGKFKSKGTWHWRQLPLVVIGLSHSPLTEADLKQLVRRGAIPDRVLVIFDAREARPRDVAAAQTSPQQTASTPPPPPLISDRVATELLKLRPGLLGVGTTTAMLDRASERFYNAGLVVLEGLDRLDTLRAGASRLLLVRGPPAVLLAVSP
ncbi:MAG: HEAT repeat domain-containing protein [Deltaproteobacteria bacterium]|nr:HEAT repeat domain-containing protein [Deltaproteobacteria bacterium]